MMKGCCRLLAWTSITLASLAAACDRSSTVATPPTSAPGAHRATESVERDAGDARAAARAESTTVADRVTGVHRLGGGLFVSFLDGDGDHAGIRVARVGDDGTIADVARGAPVAARTMTRGGSKTMSPLPTALLGEPEGPIWMALAHYSVFGDVVVYRADQGTWRCVGRCPKRPDPESWAKLTERRDSLEGHPVARGELLDDRSRGHLFTVRNRVSREGHAYLLPRATSRDPLSAVRSIRSLGPVDERDELVELADGAVVEVRKRVPELTRIDGVDGESSDDFWVLGEAALVHVRGADHRRLPLPSSDLASVVSDGHGAVWLSGGTVAYRYEGSGTEPSRRVRLADEGSVGRVVASRPNALFVVVGRAAEQRLVRVSLE